MWFAQTNCDHFFFKSQNYSQKIYLFLIKLPRCNNFVLHFHKSTTSFLSKALSKPFNFSFKSQSISMNSIKLYENLQLALRSWNQCLFINIKILKFSVYQCHLLRFTSIIIKEKSFMAQSMITMLKILWIRKPIIGNIDLCFSHHWTTHLMFFIFIWYHLKVNNSLRMSSFVSSFNFVVFSKISKLQS